MEKRFKQSNPSGQSSLNTSAEILIVDDEVNILKAMERQLHSVFAVTTALSAKEALEKIKQREEPYSVVITDMNMPNMNGLELLQEIKRLSPDTIRIMLTGNADQKTAMSAVNQGEVFRFITKPCAKEILIENIEDALSLFQEQKNNLEEMDCIQQHVDILKNELSMTKNLDAVTTLPNRTFFTNYLKGVVANIGNNVEHSLCYIDIDQFNVVNNVCGQAAGDKLLLLVSETISEHINKEDMAARLGGDQFAILLDNCVKEKAIEKISSIKTSIENKQFIWETKKYSINISGGIASTVDTKDCNELFKLASNACSYAKSNGRGHIRAYSTNDNKLLQHHEELQWVSKVNEALDENRFQLYYQPIVPIGSSEHEMYHYEILIRMLDKAGNLVEPNKFIPTVEKYNFAKKLDRWVIDNLFWWLENQTEHLNKLELCSINLSGNTLSDVNISSFILNRFKEYSIPPEKICFEITETAAITHFDIAMDFINNLKQLGCRIALDDFGSGLSSFAYLKKLPIDYLKIDGQFVKDMVNNPIDYEIVKSVNDIGHAMNKKIIAEYVENDTILEILKTLKVDFAQGFGICKPQPLEDFSPSYMIDHEHLKIRQHGA